MDRAAHLAVDPEMNDKPSFLVAVAGLDPQQVRLIEIVFRHIQYNRYVFRLAMPHQHACADIVIAGVGEPLGRELLARTRDERPSVPAIAAFGTDDPVGTRHAIEIGQLTRQLLPILNRVVEIEGLAGAAAAVPSVGDTGTTAAPPAAPNAFVPVGARAASPVPAPSAAGAPSCTAGACRRGPAAVPRVLIIEDSATVRAHLVAEFERMGLTAETAACGDEALARLEAGPIDLAMLDLGLPDTDGLSLARRIRSEPRWRDLPIVVLTSRVSALDVVRGAAAGCSAYLAKPVDAATLRRVVERQLCGTLPTVASPATLADVSRVTG